MNYRNLLFVIILITISCTPKLIEKWNRVSVQFYYSSNDFKNNQISSDNVYTEIVMKRSDFIKIGNVFENSSHNHINKLRNSWAIRYEDEDYFHLMNHKNVNLKIHSVYVKILRKGKYCVMLLDKNSLNLLRNGGSSYGGDLAGIIMKEGSKAKVNWQNQDGMEHVILFANTDIVDGRLNTRSRTLTKINVNDHLGTNFSKEEKEELKVEEILEIFSQMN